MKKKKLLIFSYSLDTGGIERALTNLLKNMNYDKYEVDLYLEENKGIYKKEAPETINIVEYHVYKHKIKFVQKALNFMSQLKFKIVNKNRYDCAILYATYSYAGSFVVRTASKNTVMFVHSDYTNLYDKNEFEYFFSSRNVQDFKNIVFVSNEAKNNFLKHYPTLSNKSHVINNLINHEEIIQISTLKTDEVFKSSDINLLFVGRLDESSKQISIQLKLIKDLHKEIPNIKLYLIGDGPNRTTYETYIAENNLQEYIFILGNKTNPYPYIKSCDYLLLTSKYEGYPMVFTESIVLKTEVLSTIKVTDEIFEIGKNFGFILPKEYDKMKEEIKIIIKNKKTNNTTFDFNKINKNRLDALERLIDDVR